MTLSWNSSSKAGVKLDDGAAPAADSLIVVTPFGHDATTAAVDEALDASRVVAVDALFPLVGAQRRTLMTTPATTRAARDAAHALFAADGVPVTVIRDSTGFVAQRVVATIVNIGCDIAQKQIATPDDIDLAVTLGLGYPRGPLALGDALGAKTILDDSAQHVQRARRPALPSVALARAARATRPAADPARRSGPQTETHTETHA